MRPSLKLLPYPPDVTKFEGKETFFSNSKNKSRNQNKRFAKNVQRGTKLNLDALSGNSSSNLRKAYIGDTSTAPESHCSLVEVATKKDSESPLKP